MTGKVNIVGGLSKNRRLHVFFLLLSSILIIFYNLGQNSFHNTDETLYALLGKEILQTGHWLTLSVEGEKYFAKPPLMIWFSTLVSGAFGFSEFSVRFPSALFGVLTIIFTYLLAERIFDRKIALLSSLIVLTCNQFIYLHSAKTGEFDTAITFFVLLSIYFIWGSKQKKKHFYLAFASIGAVAMIKSATFIVPLGILVLYLLLSGRIRDFNKWDWAAGFGIFFLIALPWHLTEFIIQGRSFVDLYFLDQMIGRRLGPGIYFVFNPLYYIKVILCGFFPWSVILPFAIIYNIFLYKKNTKDEIILLFAWAFGVLLACNVIITKYSWYIIPVYPALAILNGRFLVDLLRGISKKEILSFAVIGIVMMLIIMIPDFDYNPFERQAFKSLMKLNLNGTFLNFYNKNQGATIFVLVLMWFFMSLTIYLLLNRKDKRYLITSKVVSYALFIYLVLFSFVLVIRPLRFSNFKSDFNNMNTKIWSLADYDTVLIFYGNTLPSLEERIYLYNFKVPHKKTVTFISLDDDRLIYELLISQNKFFLMERQHYYDLRSKNILKSLLPKPIMEWNNYILLGKSRNHRPIEEKEWLIPRRINALRDNNPEIRRDVALRLGRLGSLSAAGSLIGLLDDRDIRSVSAAARALSDMRYPYAVGPLKRALKRYSEDEEPYQTISLALAYLRDRGSLDFLIRMYKINPLYQVKQSAITSPPGYSDHNRLWTAYLIMNIDPFVGQDIIFGNLLDYIKTVQNSGIKLSYFNTRNYTLYRLGNKIALDIIEQGLNNRDVLKRRVALCLLAKPPGSLTRMTEGEMDRARSLLGRTAEGGDSLELRALAKEILQKYHREAWVGW